MQSLTDTRDESTPDQIWFLEHPPVYTLGQKADPIHVLCAGDIPLVQIDRGGQVTYHGPGQLVVYPLLLLERFNLGVRTLVTLLEETVVELCALYGVAAAPDAKAPGVYIDGCKVASIGLRIRRGASYHGMAINVDMDMSPFQQINPCGYENLRMTMLSEHVPGLTIEQVKASVENILLHKLQQA